MKSEPYFIKSLKVTIWEVERLQNGMQNLTKSITIKMYETQTIIYVKWLNNKVLLYSTGNYIQYPILNHNGKEYEKESIYMYKCITLLYSRN